VEDPRVGQVLRAIRRRRGWRQSDVARRAGVSQQTVSTIELGRLGDVDLVTLRRVGSALDTTLEFAPRWRGPELGRLLDADHAALVDRAVRGIAAAGWEVLAEWTFNHFGERGSVDVVAWRPAERALLVIEVKSRIVEVGQLHAGVDRKVRIAAALLPGQRGWRPASIGAVVVLPGDPAAYAAVRRHRSLFVASFPARTIEVRRWLACPDRPLRGLWFLSPTGAAGGIHGSAPSRRQRVRQSRSDQARDPV
jgi:transcriptional regulator with XRE-family HTH domain